MYVDSRFSSPVPAPSFARTPSLVPAWCLRLALAWVDHCVARLEERLTDEFATDATAPWHDELRTLVAERERLSGHLVRRSAT